MTLEGADYDRFRRYAPLIKTLPAREPYTTAELMVPEFELYRAGGIRIYYAPFDHVNESARVILLGITPGWTQMEIAYRSARQDLLAGLEPGEVCSRVKQSASFAGSMRTNLLAMLDQLGLPQLLGIPSSQSLFADHFELVHTTSALRYPVFVEEENYTGSRPPILNLLGVGGFESLLAQELQRVPNAVIVPLGKSVATVLEHLCRRKAVRPENCLFGFPHPSGANGYRVRQFAARQAELSQRIRRLLA